MTDHPNSPQAMEAEKKTQAATSPQAEPNGMGRPAITATAETFVAQQMASESTKIEAERAKAEVVAKVMAAKSMPRSEARCRQKILEMCREPAMAGRAFYDFRQGTERVRDLTVHVATEMARIWGNMEFGILELSRQENQSEMRAFAWDLETNTCPVSNFIVPHSVDTKKGRKPLVDDRAIYNNNANQGARRMREMIFRLIPRHIRDEAALALTETLERGDGTPLPQRRRKMADAFAEIGVTPEMVEAEAGRKIDDLTAMDLANLGILFKSIRTGEITVKEAFGTGAQPTGPLAAAVAEKERAKEPEKPKEDIGATPSEWLLSPQERVIDGLTRILKLAQSAGDVSAIMEANEKRIAAESKSGQGVARSMAQKRAEQLSASETEDQRLLGAG